MGYVKTYRPLASLPPRPRETAFWLKQGLNETQIAAKMHITPPTVHVYLKALRHHFEVHSTRALLCCFIPRPRRR